MSQAGNARGQGAPSRPRPIGAGPNEGPGKIHHVRCGSGPALVLVHALGTDHAMWKPVIRRLASAREVIALDLPGFGRSEPLRRGERADPRALAHAVSELLDELNLERAHIGGCSLGGWVALELASLGRARSVGAIAPAGLWPGRLAPRPGLARLLARASLPLAPRLLRAPVVRRMVFGASLEHPERIPPGDAAHLLRGYATARGLRAANAAMRASRYEGLAELVVPVTFGWPEHDRLIARPASMPGAVRNVRLLGCGHLATWDDPGLVSRFLLDASES